MASAGWKQQAVEEEAAAQGEAQLAAAATAAARTEVAGGCRQVEAEEVGLPVAEEGQGAALAAPAVAWRGRALGSRGGTRRPGLQGARCTPRVRGSRRRTGRWRPDIPRASKAAL